MYRLKINVYKQTNKQANSCNNHVREIKFSTLMVERMVRNNGASIVAICKLFTTQAAIFFRKEPFTEIRIHCKAGIQHPI